MAAQQGAKEHRITLKVDDSDANGDWEATSDDAGNVYRYRYSGGNKGGGHVGEKVGSGPQVVHITLDPIGGATGYVIDRVTCPMDPHGQLTPARETDMQWKIDNENLEVQQAYYCVYVKRGNGSVFVCDPMISNLPR